MLNILRTKRKYLLAINDTTDLFSRNTISWAFIRLSLNSYSDTSTLKLNKEHFDNKIRNEEFQDLIKRTVDASVIIYRMFTKPF